MNYLKTSILALLAAVCATIGCSQSGDVKPAQDATKNSSESTPHTHGQGPNGGVVFDLGKFHAEFTVDHPKRECIILIIGADEKTPTAIPVGEFTLTTKETKTKEGKVVAPMTITMKAQDAAGDKASKFVGTDPGLGNVADFEGVVIAEIEGKPSQGEFKE